MTSINRQPAAAQPAAGMRASSRTLVCLVAAALCAATGVREAAAQGAAKGALQGALIGGGIGVVAALMMPRPVVKASPSSVDFGAVQLGSEQRRDITIRAGKNRQATIDRIVVSGSGFSLSEAPSLPVTIAPGEEVRITVLFRPSDGRDSGALEVRSYAGTRKPRSLKIPLKGTGS